MKWLRSWPAEVLPKRSCVWDNMPKFIMGDYDYSALASYDDDILLLEWDIAASREDKRTLEHWAERHPNQITVAPYRLYENRPDPVWAHRLVHPEYGERWVTPLDQCCDYFSFGMIYLPHDLLVAFLKADPDTRATPIGVEPGRYQDYRLTDQTFSVWYHRTIKQRAVIDWQMHPVHLNYPL